MSIPTWGDRLLDTHAEAGFPVCPQRRQPPDDVYIRLPSPEAEPQQVFDFKLKTTVTTDHPAGVFFWLQQASNDSKLDHSGTQIFLRIAPPQ
ncbi:hypothetical protein CLAFUW4_10702 [Fulvia fulva]|uniref:Uncharacterized protein n=1 Tax=Passalora fulva TaxID=5499 RepID=A0A9Q8LEJ8_PASFU|nr:uncharacterized protein CLAFUR5_05316 [Fulvia fulva]KAK4615874.1 hypothetical protein CLAFUR4_10707 [Fulvia fulva]KAK4616614.1 hypothetical protein CLAFUR0_10713 [Fulvia fulva]UJO15942.1 hypothetical protein CLAFUR5_05316 [Fulvia fulva]WPV19703.1 hypothetical protein CLAFUW4_10702 [Fulvia fulva]WPV33779.1 hypothetical protein CLAFUW7_10704 [Fulvia fulva]